MRITRLGPTDLSWIELPQPSSKGRESFEESLGQRRSVRQLSPNPLTIQAIGQILWAAQGITSAEGKRVAPSAGALYPLEIYLAAGNVREIDAGIYKYRPEHHQLRMHIRGDLRAKLTETTHQQYAVKDGSAVIVIAADYGRTAVKYGSRGDRYVHMEVGHVAQNIYLQAHCLDLSTVMVGSFDDDALRRVLELPDNEAPLALLPVGATANAGRP